MSCKQQMWVKKKNPLLTFYSHFIYIRLQSRRMLFTPPSLIWAGVANHQATAQTLAANPEANGHNSPFLFLFHSGFFLFPLFTSSYLRFLTHPSSHTSPHHPQTNHIYQTHSTSMHRGECWRRVLALLWSLPTQALEKLQLCLLWFWSDQTRQPPRYTHPHTTSRGSTYT